MTTFRVQQWFGADLVQDGPVWDLVVARVHEQFQSHARQHNVTLNEASITEVERRALAWRDIGDVDDDGEPTSTLVQIGSQWCPDETIEPDTYMIVWEAEAS